MEDQNMMIEQIMSIKTMEKAKKRLRLPVGGVTLTPEQIEETWEAFLENRERILAEMIDGTWKLQPAKQVSVERKDGTMRNVLIPVPEDRLILEAAFLVLNRELKKHRQPSVYDYDYHRGVSKALRSCRQNLQSGYSWTLQLDVANCSESLSRSIVLDHLRPILNEEQSTITLFERLMELTHEESFNPDSEPAGIHPSTELVNQFVDVCMMDLDEMLVLQEDVRFVRFGDDVMVFCKTYDQTLNLIEPVVSLLRNRLGLSLNPAKSALQRGKYGPFLGDLFVYYPKNKRYIHKTLDKKEYPKKVVGYHFLDPEEESKYQRDFVVEKKTAPSETRTFSKRTQKIMDSWQRRDHSASWIRNDEDYRKKKMTRTKLAHKKKKKKNYKKEIWN